MTGPTPAKFLATLVEFRDRLRLDLAGGMSESICQIIEGRLCALDWALENLYHLEKVDRAAMAKSLAEMKCPDPFTKSWEHAHAAYADGNIVSAAKWTGMSVIALGARGPNGATGELAEKLLRRNADAVEARKALCELLIGGAK
jgi:hypothetical protein